MSNRNSARPSFIDRSKLPAQFPTNCHSPQFWEQLGRTVASFGFLEEILGKAIFAFTGNRKYEAHEIEKAYEEWLPKLTRALIDPICNLAESYGKAARECKGSNDDNISEIVFAIKDAAVIRNVLCHGSWRPPNSEGRSLPLYVNKHGKVFQTPIDVQFLRQVQKQVKDIACAVADTVTQMGLPFPGYIGQKDEK